MKQLACALLLLSTLTPIAPLSPLGEGMVRGEALLVSGVIQAREIAVAAEIGGRVTAVYATEGDKVEAASLLVTLDDTLWQSNLSQAQAARQAAEAELAALKAGATPEQIAVAQAAVDQARTAQAGAEKLYQDAIAVRQAPQELEARLIAAKTQVHLAEQTVEKARADLERAAFQRDQKPFNSRDWQAAEYARQAAAHGLAAAQADLEAAQALVDGLEAMRARPLALLAAEHRAAGEVSTCAAALTLAEARLADLLAGPTPEEIAVAEARLRLAQAQEQALRHQMEHLQIVAPAGGVVLARLVEPGEAVQPGATLLRLSDLTRLKLVLYVPEPHIGEVGLGQQVQITVDAYPGHTFVGRVQRIADHAEYTPRNTATRAERVNTYYAVTVDLPNTDGLLKPGMAAEAMIELSAVSDQLSAIGRTARRVVVQVPAEGQQASLEVDS